MEKIKVLLLEDTPICYDSTLYFRQMIQNALEMNGCLVTCGQSSACGHFDAVFGINSDYPVQQAPDGRYFWEKRDIPFYQLILDHPLYHHDRLKENMRNYHVLCLDEKHKTYILKYYPHIKNVTVISLSIESLPDTEEHFEQIWQQKSIDVLFTGTYTSPAQIREKWNRLPEQIRTESWELAQRMVEEPLKTQEEVLIEMLAEHPEVKVSDERFREAMNWYFLADTYASAYYREKIIYLLAKNRIPLHLIGHGWDSFISERKLSTQEAELLHLHGEVPYAGTAAYMRKARLCLNVQPWFKAGIHDRILSAMGQASCCLTDGEEYLQRFFTERETIFYYNLEQLEQLPDQIDRLLQEEGQMEQVSRNALDLVQHHFTWKRQFEAIVSEIRRNG